MRAGAYANMPKPVLIPSGGITILRAVIGREVSRMRQARIAAAPSNDMNSSGRCMGCAAAYCVRPSCTSRAFLRVLRSRAPVRHGSGNDNPGRTHRTSRARCRSPSERISWGAIIGGAVTALGVGALLYALGFALGLSAINPDNPSSFRASSIFTGIWSLVTSFLALFAGGMVASRGAGVYTRARSRSTAW